MALRLWNLPIQRRILYLIYTDSSLMYDNIKPYFQPYEQNEFEKQYQLLINDHIISYSDCYTCDCIHDPFLHILSYLYTSPNPITKDEIRIKMKHRELNHILNDLIQSGIIFEYRAELTRKNFIIPIIFRDTIITQINNDIQSKLAQSDNLNDQSHLIMLQQERSILSYTNQSNIKFTDLTTNEIKLIVNLYDDIKEKKIRTVGQSCDYIIDKIFNGHKKIASKTILSLIDKGILQCSYKNHYFINNWLFTQINPLYEQHQKKVIKNLNQ